MSAPCLIQKQHNHSRGWLATTAFTLLLTGNLCAQALPERTPPTVEPPAGSSSPSGGEQGPSHSSRPFDNSSHPGAMGSGSSNAGSTTGPTDWNASSSHHINPRPHHPVPPPHAPICIPSARPQLLERPTGAYWTASELMAGILKLVSTHFIPVTPIDGRIEALRGYSHPTAGWKAYGIIVPPGGTVILELQHPMTGWFQLRIMDKWGDVNPAMRTEPNPKPLKVGYRNTTAQNQPVYVMVEDPGWKSDASHPFSLLIRKDWDPSKAPLHPEPLSAGIWKGPDPVTAATRISG